MKRLLCLTALLAGCLGETEARKGATDPQILAYLDELAPILVGRLLTPEEHDRIVDDLRGKRSDSEIVRGIISEWMDDPFVAMAARDLMQKRLAVSGARDGINFELPGNLAHYLVEQDRPWSEILTADYCVGDDLTEIPCDSGAPYTAGVLTTRAYLLSRSSRFNLTRASAMMGVFACQEYPLPDDLEPRVPKERLKTMFRAQTPEEQEDPAAAEAFGNGHECYTCHGQFSSHAQLFIEFDDTGVWRTDTNGLQDPAGELGRAVAGMFASHFEDPEEAKSPASQMFGVPARDLSEAAAVLAASPEFYECAAKNIADYALRLDERTEIPEDLLAEISETISTLAEPATFQDLLVETLSHPRVVASAVAHLGAPHESP